MCVRCVSGSVSEGARAADAGGVLIVSGGHTLLYEVKTAGESNGGAFGVSEVGWDSR